MTLHIVNSTSGMIRVHRAGCRDIGRDVQRSNSTWTMGIEADATRDDIEQAVVMDLNESFGWSPDSDEPQPFHGNDIEILPCCGR